MVMKRFLHRWVIIPAVLITLVLATTVSFVAVEQAAAQEEPVNINLEATLEGEEEVPGPGDPDGTGLARFVINQDVGRVCYAVFVSGITLPTAGAHIHRGEEGVAGEIVVPLTQPDEMGFSGSCIDGVDPALLEEILANPAGFYANVHTPELPEGAVRGQLRDVTTNE